MKELICIICPKGCHLRIDEEQDYKVSGNGCLRGIEYAKNEVTHPMRMITSTIRIQHARYPRVSVKTSIAVPKECIWDIMRRLCELEVSAPVHLGDVIEHNICGSNADLVITKNMERRK